MFGLVSTVLLLAANSPARADIVLDQSNVYPTFIADLAVITGQELAQTWTVGLEGTLAQIDVQISKETGTTGDVTLTIRATADGVPDSDDSQVLFATVISLDDIPTIDDHFQNVPLTSIDVSDAGLAVQPGDVLTVALSRMGPGSPPWVTWRCGPPTYQGGQLFIRSGPDFDWKILDGYEAGFQTYVDVGP
jgi:hypothetical protein